MALMQCPECGREVSDKAESCPNCGCPILSASEAHDSQHAHITNKKFSPMSTNRRKKTTTICLAIVLFFSVIAGLMVSINHKKSLDQYNAYLEDLELVRTTMLRGAADSESLCNLTKKVWYNTIYEESDSETNVYTKTYGSFHEDFNTSLSLLYSSDSTKQSVSEIEANREEVFAIMSRLQTPPEALTSCYSIVSDMYDVYISFTDLAISPSGSLKTYSENFSEYDDDFMKYYNHLDLQLKSLSGSAAEDNG